MKLPRQLLSRSVAVLSTTTTTLHSMNVSSYLEQARQLKVPSREEMLRRDPSVQYFWQRNKHVLERAWEEWADDDNASEASLPVLDDSLYDPKLRKAFAEAWMDPSKEYMVRALWQEVAPGVFQCQFFDPDKITHIRAYLDRAAKAGIPARPPYGIVLNRNGFMIDPRSEGYLAIPKFQTFYRDLMDSYMRPLGRLFFPEYIQEDDDSETFAFSIQYQAGKDQSIRQHSDSSSLTLNINLNMPTGEEFEGSSLYFVDPATGEKNIVNFAPGVAVMHRGATPHAALPITKGERSNLVLWLVGKNGHTSYFPYAPGERMTRQERWTKPPKGYTSSDCWAPF